MRRRGIPELEGVRDESMADRYSRTAGTARRNVCQVVTVQIVAGINFQSGGSGSVRRFTYCPSTGVRTRVPARGRIALV